MNEFEKLDPIFLDSHIAESKKLILKSKFPETSIIHLCQENNIVDCQNDLIIVAKYIYQLSLGGYEDFIRWIEFVDPFQKEFDIINDLIARNKKGFQCKIRSVTIYYEDSNGETQTDILSNKHFLSNLHMALYEKFNQKFWDANRKNYKNYITKGKKDPYAIAIKYWIKKINQYLQNKILIQKDRFNFIGYFLKESGMPIVYVSTKKGSYQKGQPIQDVEFPQRIKDYLK